MLAIIATLLLVLTIEVGYLIYHLRTAHSAPPFPTIAQAPAFQAEPDPPPPAGVVQIPVRESNPHLIELLYKDVTSGAWRHHSWRAHDAKDVLEALATPGLAIRTPDGIVEGKQ